jgi:hypothetical protein
MHDSRRKRRAHEGHNKGPWKRKTHQRRGPVAALALRVRGCPGHPTPACLVRWAGRPRLPPWHWAGLGTAAPYPPHHSMSEKTLKAQGCKDAPAPMAPPTHHNYPPCKTNTGAHHSRSLLVSVPVSPQTTYSFSTPTSGAADSLNRMKDSSW